MKLSKSTLTILKNFSVINQGITVKPGSVLKTIDLEKNTYAVATVPEEFEREFSIYNLGELLNIILPDNDLLFDEDSLKIVDNQKRKVNYTYSSPNVVTSPKDKAVVVEGENKKFILTKEDLDSIYKKSDSLKIYDLFISCSGLTLRSKKEDDGNTYEVPLAIKCTKGSKPSLIDIRNLKILLLDYDVSVVDNTFVHFKSRNEEYCVEYFITVDFLEE